MQLISEIIIITLILGFSVIIHELAHLFMLKEFKVPYSFKILDFKHDALFEFIYQEPKDKRIVRLVSFVGYYTQELYLLLNLLLSLFFKEEAIVITLTFVLIILKLMVPNSHDYKLLLR